MVRWIKSLVSGTPHFIIGRRDDPYLLRWYLIPRNPFLNVYLHKFLRDDDDRALHDHPWWFISLMIRGRYSEETEKEVLFDDKLMDGRLTIHRSSPSVAFRKATHRHRVVLLKDEIGRAIPCWTIVITGRKVREWGFWCPKGFVPWHVFCDREDTGSVGKGCE